MQQVAQVGLSSTFSSAEEGGGEGASAAPSLPASSPATKLSLASPPLDLSHLIEKTDTQQLLCAECHGHEEPGAMESEGDPGTLLGLEVGWLFQICDILAEALGGE